MLCGSSAMPDPWCQRRVSTWPRKYRFSAALSGGSRKRDNKRVRRRHFLALPCRAHVLAEEPSRNPALAALILDLAPARSRRKVALSLGHALPLLKRHVVRAAIVLEAARVVRDAQ